MKELADQGVTRCYNVTKDGNKTNTGTFILSFCTPEVPEEDLQIGYISVPVTAYIPNPLRCFKCQRFGHGEKVCNKEAVCVRCAETGHSDTLRKTDEVLKLPGCSLHLFEGLSSLEGRETGPGSCHEQKL